MWRRYPGIKYGQSKIPRYGTILNKPCILDSSLLSWVKMILLMKEQMFSVYPNINLMGS